MRRSCSARPEAAHLPERSLMAIADMIPGMDDSELANLRQNAQRLTASAVARQQEQAVALLPLIDAELAQRAAAKPASKAAAPKSRKAKVQAAAAAASAELEADEADEEPANDDDPTEL